MTFGWILLGTLGQLMLAVLLFMGVVFSAGGLGAGARLGKAELRILNLSIYLLPALCVLSAAIVIGLYLHGGSAASYGWYVLPLVGAVSYFAYAVMLGRRS